MTHAATPPLPYGLRSPAFLFDGYLSILGGDLLGNWIGEDFTLNATNDVTGWLGRLGGTVTPVVPGQYRTAAAMRGRRTSIGSEIGQPRGLSLASAFVAKSFICCVKVPPLPVPNVYADIVAGNSGDNHAIVITANTSNLYTASGWQHYVNGVATETLAGRAGETVVIEGYNAAAVQTGIRIGSHATLPTWTFPTDISCVVALAIVQSPAQRVAGLKIQTEYNQFRA